MDGWYEVVAERTLAQGDLLLRCPVPQVESYAHPLPDNVPVVVDERDLIVLTQSCDLENDKVDEVLLAAVRDYQSLAAREGQANQVIRSKRWRENAVRGDLAAYSLLPPHETPAIDWCLVDFHHLFTLSKAYIEDFAEAAGDRLRLVPPYREHLAQAFARYVMRVGLPTPLSAFENVAITDPG